MKVELIRITSQRSAFWKPDLQALTLPTLAGLTPSGIEVKLTTERNEEINYQSDADLIGITFLSFLASRAYTVADRYRRLGKKVVIGGPHATVVPEEAINHADAVVIGEAEDVWPQLLHDFGNGGMRRFYQARQLPALDHLPPARKDLKKTKGICTISMVQTGRGCPFNCDYCYTSMAFGKKFRLRPVGEVIEEIAKIPGKFVLFADDNLIGDTTYAKELFRRMIPLGKSWFSQLSINIARDDELLDLAAKSGGKVIGVGIESVNQASLNEVSKTFNKVDRYTEEIRKIHDHGIAVLGYFMFGFDHDDRSVFEKTVEFVERARITARPYILTPYPKTRIYNRMKEEGRLFFGETIDWSKTDGTHVCFRPKKMSAEALQEGFRWVEKRLYSVPSIIRKFGWVLGNTTPFYTLASSIFIKGGRMNRNGIEVPVRERRPSRSPSAVDL
jgi:radical SAM superfamily enzyme YgiQ (UPF0313 family)